MVYELGLGFDDCKRGFVAGHLSLPFALTAVHCVARFGGGDLQSGRHGIWTRSRV